jgi:hypothetical protein
MSRTPNTPFIPPLPASPDASPGPEHPPVIPTGTPNWNQPIATGGGYVPFNASPYSAHSPFVPILSPMVTPGVIPGMFSPQQQPKVNRQGFSEDFTGYPPGSGGGGPPMLSPSHPTFFYGSHPNSPNYPQSAPPTFQGYGTPWNSNAAQLPSTPWGGFQPFGNYGPPPPLTAPPPMGGLPPRMGNIPPSQMGNPMMNGQGPPWQGGAAAYPPFHGPDPGPWGGLPNFGQHQQPQLPFRAPPEPPSQIFDRMDPFTEGKDCTSIFFVQNFFFVQELFFFKMELSLIHS